MGIKTPQKTPETTKPEVSLVSLEKLRAPVRKAKEEPGGKTLERSKTEKGHQGHSFLRRVKTNTAKEAEKGQKVKKGMDRVVICNSFCVSLYVRQDKVGIHRVMDLFE